MKYTPRDYQLQAAKHLLSNPGAALFLEPGLGKTSITLLALTTLLRAKSIRRVLIVAPLRVCYGVWPKEAEKWDTFQGLRVGILHGSKKDAVLAGDANICVINPEGLPWLVKQGAHRDFDALVVDESTKFKSRDTQRWSLMLQIIERKSVRWILTGTPAPNNLLDLWTQMFICDQGKRLSRYITHFRREYFDEIVQAFGHVTVRNYVPRRDTAQRIQAKVKDIALYMAALDHLKMPTLLLNTINIELPSAALRAYQRIEDGLLAQIDGVSISTAQASAISMKLRQLTGGLVYGSGEEVAAAHTAKIDALIDLIEEQNGQPLLVAVGFQHEAAALQAAIKKEFKVDAPYLGGGISAAAGDRIATEWNAGKLPVLLAHPASVAHGLNLQAGGRAVCWFTPTWSLEEYLQFNARVWRQGQKSRTVVIHSLVATGTIDETVIARVSDKDATQRSLLDTLKARKKEKSK